MDKRYSHQEHEQKAYQLWEKSGAFNPDNNTPTTGESFSILMPPPNANDPLHIGHAMFVTLEDIMVRYHRMKGDDTVWIPGTDHAGIETQFVFEKKLKKEGKSRFNFDRETLYKKIWDYVQDNSGVAVDQMKQIGASADWSRFKFMLDEDIVEQVLETFALLAKDDLIYRDKKLVNYCTKCGTSYSELEVDYANSSSPLYFLKYGPLTVATTRPETMFGDVAVAVSKEDGRYADLIGKTIQVTHPNGAMELKVIADEYVDPEFGTGAVKITPYHDFNDFDVWQRHQDELPQPQEVIGLDGKLTTIAGKYARLRVKPGREALVKDLTDLGLIERIDQNYNNRVGTCYRCKSVIEPLPLPQFFVKVKPLIDPVLAALDADQVKIHGAGHDKILRHWLENLKDWNISRQIVWGIRMPVWYQVTPQNSAHMQVGYIKDGKYSQGVLKTLLDNGETLENITDNLQTLIVDEAISFSISKENPGLEDGNAYIQETDTFDTWFSSGQWPITTLQNNQDFERFYPTTVMETAYDILMFWVMRMLMFGIYLSKNKTGRSEVPFKHVYLHGLIRDQKGAKMSKSKGNVVNPLEIIEEYGADALRLALVIRSTPGLDKSIGIPDFKAGRNLTNKLWNSARFITMSQEKMVDSKAENDKIFFDQLNSIIYEVTQQLEDYKIGLAADTLYDKFWHWFCDDCIEQAKDQKISKYAILAGLKTFLLLFHPFIPFVTETIWQELKHQYPAEYDKNQLLISSEWPVASK